MMSRADWTNIGRAACIAGLGLALLSGCGKKEEEAPPPPPPPPPAPVEAAPDPEKVDLSLLAQEISPDSRVNFQQDLAPYDRSFARAVFEFASALARGDAEAFGRMLDEPNREILDELVREGEWGVTDDIEAVAVARLNQSPDVSEAAETAEIILAVQEPGGSYITGWNAAKAAGVWVFSGYETSRAELPLAEMWIGQRNRAYRPGGEPDADR